MHKHLQLDLVCENYMALYYPVSRIDAIHNGNIKKYCVSTFYTCSMIHACLYEKKTYFI